jgi:hypothetical protein
LGRPRGQSRRRGDDNDAIECHDCDQGQGAQLEHNAAQAARRLGITQPRLNDLLHGKINKFFLDTLMTLATRAGLKIKIEVRSAA